MIAYNINGIKLQFDYVRNTTIRGNRIFNNGLLGIDLTTASGVDGVTPNDPGDADIGPNDLQNYPVLTGATPVSVAGTLNSTPDRTFTLEFFSNSECDPSGYGEGETFQPTTAPATVTTDGSGDAAFTFTFASAIPEGQFITATATNLDGSTSEFSACREIVRPTKPSNLTGIGISMTQIDLSWTDNSADEAAFYIERSPAGLNDWDEIGSVEADVTTYSDTEVVCGTTYDYRVRAFRSIDGQYSDYSNVAHATTTLCPPPNAPTSLSATGVSGVGIDLSWTDHADDEANFHIERSPAGQRRLGRDRYGRGERHHLCGYRPDV